MCLKASFVWLPFVFFSPTPPPLCIRLQLSFILFLFFISLVPSFCLGNCIKAERDNWADGSGVYTDFGGYKWKGNERENRERKGVGVGKERVFNWVQTWQGIDGNAVPSWGGFTVHNGRENRWPFFQFLFFNFSIFQFYSFSLFMRVFLFLLLLLGLAFLSCLLFLLLLSLLVFECFSFYFITFSALFKLQTNEEVCTEIKWK